MVQIAIDRIERARSEGYDKGFLAGEAVGRKQIDNHFDRGLGIGFCIGVGVGGLLALIVVPYIARFA